MRAGLALAVALAGVCSAGARAPRQKRSPTMEPTRSEAFKTVKGVTLQMHIFEPEGLKPTDKRPAAVFFFGGGWTGGSPTQFFPQCKYLASRGMVAMSAEYRVKGRHGVTPFECVTDAKSAVRWVRANAAKLGVDPERIAAGGGSAGGHVAAATGTIDGLEEEGEDAKISSKPNAMLLFNPALVLDFAEWEKRGIATERLEQIRARFQGREPKEISPAHHVAKGVAPTLIFHGKSDTTVPYATAERFAQVMKQKGNRCELVGYEGQGHGFFNFGRGDGEAFYRTLAETDKFLASLGWLEGEPTIEEFRKAASQR